MKKKYNNTLFYVVIGYILLQFVWWEVLLVNQTREIHNEKEKIVALGATSDEQLHKQLEELATKEQQRIYMILGEGTIFLIIITIAIIRVYKAHKREQEIALQQKNFLLSVSHELKTPLATSKLNLQTLLTRELQPDLQKEIISNSLYENERLTQLIENILISTRLDDSAETGSLLINRESLDLSAFCHEIISKSFSETQKKRIEIKIEAGIMFTTDKAIFPSIVINLVENALKYSAAETSVLFELKKNGSDILLSVYDKGVGISESDKKNIFNKFFRAGNEETRSTKGTGLGLFIVKKIIEMHNGSISIKNNAPGGSIFEVKLPA